MAGSGRPNGSTTTTMPMSASTTPTSSSLRTERA
jgi:hypothetical protein